MFAWSSGRIRSARGAALLVVAALLAALGVALSPPAPASAASDPGFNVGSPAYSTIVDCSTIVWGGYGTSKGVMAWAGVYLDADTPAPKVNQTFYVSITAGGIGMPCAGQGFWPGFTLPNGLELDTSQNILCWMNNVAQSGVDCPQSITPGGFGANSYTYYSGANADYGHAFTASTGMVWEFRFPVKATKTFTAAKFNAYVNVLDGWDDPLLEINAPLNVFPGSAGGGGGGGGTSVETRYLFEAPSTIANPGSPYGLHSEGVVYTDARPGKIYITMAKGKKTGSPGTWSGTGTLVFPVDNSDSGWRVWSDWEESEFPTVQPGSLYSWAIGFKPTGGSMVWSSAQRFTGLAQSTCNGQAITVSIGLGQLPTSGNDVILGTPGKDTIAAGAGNDRVCGLGGDDVISTGTGSDWVDAGGGNDVVIPSDGYDTVLGGSGTDTLDFSAQTAAVNIDLAVTTQTTSPGTGLITIGGFENVVGGSGNDTLRGDAGNNVIVGGPGNDVLNGRDGVDTVSYAGAPSGITLSLTLFDQQNTGGAGFDTVGEFENVTGSGYGDHISGLVGPNVLIGLGGNDVLSGMDGPDKLYGGPGKDTLNGGPGKDFGDGGSGKDSATSVEKKKNIP